MNNKTFKTNQRNQQKDMAGFWTPSRKLIGSASIVMSLFAAVLIGNVLVSAGTDIIFSRVMSVPNANAGFTTTGTGSWRVAADGYSVTGVTPFEDTASGNASVSINQTKFTYDTWQYTVSALAAGSSARHDFSVIFDYTDQDNYYFAHFSDLSTPLSNGIFRVSSGNQEKLAQFESTIEPDKAYVIEVRKENNIIKVYRDGVYLGRADSPHVTGMMIGLGTRGGDAVFTRLQLEAEDVR